MKLSAFVVAALATIVSMVGCGDNTAQMEASLDERDARQLQDDLRKQRIRRAANR